MEANRVTAFKLKRTKLYGTVITSWTQDNSKLLQQSRPGFKRTNISNKYQSKLIIQEQSQYLDYLINPRE